MGKLILAGGGDEVQSRIVDKEFVGLINKDKPMLYIPVAMDTKMIPYDSCKTWINRVFNPLGIKNITMWTEQDLYHRKVEDLTPFSSVYIGGGNTYSLLHFFYRTQFTTVLKEYVKNKGIIYGGSAGAIIFGKDIRTCSHMDDNNAGLNELNGLGLVKQFSIWCHYKKDNDGLIHNYLQQINNHVIALPEETALRVDESGMKVLGSKPAYIFDGDTKKQIQPGCEW
ncbi:Type 1 glutamine amidotransferase-like domain-containing protein [Bacillus alkalicellulosilyticus]|uniref:Type 1 glutamine amidotransferase-like domain-containing protein n=1 Tax=Alkalihalobacterium alkalicellulosilyticum TaxID=1912214 RepID=UPI000998A9F6|nr:Type 1 glutamine amidotransferase-like domain-containing protein [Bacillus alkalicellulosilyticus]